MSTHKSAEQQFIERQIAVETLYRAALDARQSGSNLSTQVRAGIEAVIDFGERAEANAQANRIAR